MPNQFASANPFPTIPVPSDDPKALRKSVEALMRTVQMLTQKDTSALDGSKHNRFSQHVFIQRDEPTALHDGDQWLCLVPPATFNIWTGGKWVVLLTLP